MLRIISTLLFAVVSLVKLDAQQSVSLADIEHAYRGDFTLSVKAVFKYSPDFTKSYASDSLDALMVMHGNDYYFKISEFEIVKESTYNLSVDNDLKSIEVSRNSTEADVLTYGIIDQLLSQQNAKVSSFDTGDPSLSGIRIQFQNSEVIHADLFIDQRTNYIRKCVIKYINGVDELSHALKYARLEIRYFDYVKEYTALPTEKFGLKKFVDISGNQVILRNPYKSYHLQTNLN